MVARELAPSADVAVSPVPEAITTPAPANNNRRLWAVLGGVAALAAAVLVTVQVTMTAGQATLARESSAPALAQGPAMDQAPGAARQPDKAQGDTVVTEVPATGRLDNTLDAVADLGELEEDGLFEFANERDRSGVLQEDLEGGGGVGGRVVADLEGLVGGNETPTTLAPTGSSGDPDDFRSRGLSDAGVSDVGADSVDRNQIVSAPEPVATFARPAPVPASAPELERQRETTVAAADTPAPPPPVVAPAEVDEALGGEFFDAAVADMDLEFDMTEQEDDLLDDLEARSETVSLDQTTSTRGSRGRDERRSRPSREPQAQEAAQEPSSVAAAPAAPSRLLGIGSSVDAGVIQAQQRAVALAGRQQFSAAFDTLSPYISPSAPIDIVLDATEYAFAAGRWADTVRVASIRIDANVPSDSLQSRSRLYDYRARAQAMQDQRMMAPSTTGDRP
jgi:hypothetical protein